MKIVIVLLVCLMVSLSSVQGQDQMKWSTERCNIESNEVSGSYPNVYSCSDYCKSEYYNGPVANIGYCTVKSEGIAFCKCGLW